MSIPINVPIKQNHTTRFKLTLFLPLFLVLGIIMLVYNTVCIEGGKLSKPVSLKIFLDDWIPFNFYIIFPYVICLGFVLFAGIFFAFNRKISIIQIISFYCSVILMYFLTYVIYLIFPTTAQDVMISSFNPSVLNWGMYRVIKGLYGLSTPLGDFPSLHVAPMVFMSFFLYKNWRTFFWRFFPIAFLGATGTVLLKFHVFLGFFGGVLMGIFGYFILYEKFVYKMVSKGLDT